MLKNIQKVTLFEQLKLIVYLELEMNDSWWQSVMSGFFGGTQLHGIPVFYRMHCFNGTIQSEVSTTLKLSPRLSFIPIQLQVYILERYTDKTPLGQNPLGQNPLGQNPLGQNPSRTKPL